MLRKSALSSLMIVVAVTAGRLWAAEVPSPTADADAKLARTLYADFVKSPEYKKWVHPVEA